MKKRISIIAMIILLMVTCIILIDVGMRGSKTHANVYTGHENNHDAHLYGEKKVFERSESTYNYKDMKFDSTAGHTGEAYHSRRAYPGAPPTIPHPLFTERGIGANGCLQCHQNGGYVNSLEAYAPITPHPEMLNCRQCHVPVKTNAEFAAGSLWEKQGVPEIHRAALTGSPPMIPHDLQMKENCLSCHYGPGSRKDIRVSHPERVNCRQCHVPNHAALKGLEQEFTRQPQKTK